MKMYFPRNQIFRIRPLCWRKLLLGVVLICSKLAAFPAASQDLSPLNNTAYGTQTELVDAIKLTVEDTSLSLSQKIALLEQYALDSESQRWIDAMFDAKSAKLDLLINYERMQDAQKVVLDIDQTLYEQLNVKQKINFKRSELWVADALSQQQTISDSRADLLGFLGQIERFETEQDYFFGLTYLALGQSQADTQEQSQAIQNYQKAFTYFEKIGDLENLGMVLGSLGSLYIDIDSPQKSIEYFEQALEVQAQLDMLYEASVTLYNLSTAYESMDDFANARKTLQKSREISVQLDDEIGVAWCDQSLAFIELEAGNYTQALRLLENTTKIFADSHGAHMQYTGLFGMARAHLGLQDFDQAKQYLAQSQSLYEQIENPNLQLERIIFKAKLDHRQGKFTDTFTDMSRALDLQKEIFKAEKDALVDKYRVEFDTEFKENQNKVLLQRNELSAQTIKQQKQQQKLWIMLILVCLICMVVIAVFLIKQNKLRKEFKALALRDPLTNQPNRRSILERASQVLADPSNDSFVIVIIDIDSFKKINDRFGHDTGDNVLKGFGAACQSAIKTQDCFGRYGGEEWLLVLKEADEHSLSGVFKRIFETVNANPIEGMPDSEVITFSMGAAVVNQNSDVGLHSVSELISVADAQLYIAKNQGRNRYLFEVIA